MFPKFLHVFKKTTNVGARAPQTAEVLDNMNYVDLENFGTGDAAKSSIVYMEAGLDKKTNFHVDVASSVFLSNLEKDALSQQFWKNLSQQTFKHMPEQLWTRCDF